MVAHQIILNVRNFSLSDKSVNLTINDQLKKRGRPNITVEVEIVGVSQMKALNHKYMSKDCATDVLSFPLHMIPGEKVENIGTIVLCSDIIKLQAKEHGVSFEGECTKMLRHGVDHLLGFHHK